MLFTKIHDFSRSVQHCNQLQYIHLGIYNTCLVHSKKLARLQKTIGRLEKKLVDCRQNRH